MNNIKKTEKKIKETERSIERLQGDLSKIGADFAQFISKNTSEAKQLNGLGAILDGHARIQGKIMSLINSDRAQLEYLQKKLQKQMARVLLMPSTIQGEGK